MTQKPKFPNPATWFEIYVEDMERAKKFYETTFEVQLQPLNVEFPQMLAFPNSPDFYGCGGALVKMDGAGGHGKLGTLIYFECEHCGVTAQRAEKAGGTIEKETFSIGEYGFVAIITDTEGNLVGLHSMPVGGC